MIPTYRLDRCWWGISLSSGSPTNQILILVKCLQFNLGRNSHYKNIEINVAIQIITNNPFTPEAETECFTTDLAVLDQTIYCYLIHLIVCIVILIL